MPQTLQDTNLRINAHMYYSIQLVISINSLTNNSNAKFRVFQESPGYSVFQLKVHEFNEMKEHLPFRVLDFAWHRPRQKKVSKAHKNVNR